MWAEPGLCTTAFYWQAVSDVGILSHSKYVLIWRSCSLQEAIFVCMQCGDAYAWSQALLRHQNYKHPDRTDEEKATQKILNRRAKDAVLVRYPNMVLEPNESRDTPRIPRWDSDLAWEESPAIAPLSVPVRPLLHGAFALQQSTREHMDHPSPKPHPYLR